MNIIEHTTNPISAGIIALLGALALKFVDKFLVKNKETLDENIQLRKELREEIEYLHERIEDLNKELTEWKTKYWIQVEEIAELKSENVTLHSKIEQLLEDKLDQGDDE